MQLIFVYDFLILPIYVGSKYVHQIKSKSIEKVVIQMIIHSFLMYYLL